MSALSRPASTKIWENVMTIVAAATTPNSPGTSSRARTSSASILNPFEASSATSDHLNAPSAVRNRLMTAIARGNRDLPEVRGDVRKRRVKIASVEEIGGHHPFPQSFVVTILLLMPMVAAPYRGTNREVQIHSPRQGSAQKEIDGTRSDRPRDEILPPRRWNARPLTSGRSAQRGERLRDSLRKGPALEVLDGHPLRRDEVMHGGP